MDKNVLCFVSLYVCVYTMSEQASVRERKEERESERQRDRARETERQRDKE